ncbi:UNVERIFIED_CONTAM: hypothetical protein Slati_1416300 [Sesamum latifolium]|uniref:SWIM-type domain-containing protein n=1 Tax=Sesamum latifolium TaxID=2727402 RepID=A0AAW2X3W1_9LAMI
MGGLRQIKDECPDIYLIDMLNSYRGFDVPIQIYVEEEEGKPIQVVDSQGNAIEKQTEQEIMYLLNGINFTDEFINDNEVGVQQKEGMDECRNEVGVEEMDDCSQTAGVEVNECSEPVGLRAENDDVRVDNIGKGGFDSFAVNEETGLENQPSAKNKGKRKLSEVNYNDESDEDCSGFDDSSDKDYHQLENESESPSLVLEGMEGESEEDIFQENNNNNVKPMKEFVVNDEDWYNEVERDSDLESLHGEDDDIHNHPYYNDQVEMRDLNLVVGLKFASCQVFREVLRDWTYDNSFAKAKYSSMRMEDAIRNNSNIPVGQLKNTIMRKCRVDVSRWKVQRAKRQALDTIRGRDAIQYELLWDYCETVRAKNPGSKIILRRQEGSDPPLFERLYYSLSAMKLGFLEGCRPIIGLDGCFLKIVYQGQLLVAVGRDGNDNMMPIAIVVVQVENRENWSWFIGELLDDIGGLGADKWSFISDRQKGLVDALRELAPGSEHKFCVRHLYENFKAKFKGAELNEYLWKAATTANKQEFRAHMKKIVELNPKKSQDYETAAEWLSKIPAEHWSRAFFPMKSKCDILVNNLCESFNNFILDARDKPIIIMLECIRTKLMTRLQCKRVEMEKYTGSVCPNVLKKVNKQGKLARHCFNRWCGASEFEIDHFLHKYIVDLDKKTCTCCMFQLTGYPCCHAYSAIADMRHEYEDYVDACYKKPVYLKAYEYMIHGVPGQEQYVNTGSEPLKAPRFKKKRGRPVKMRRKGPNEVQSVSSTRK